MYSHRTFILALFHLLVLFSHIRESSSSCSELHHFTVSSSSGVDNSTCVSRDPGVPCLTLEYLISNLQQHDCLNITILNHQTLSNTIIQLINYSDVTIYGKEVNILCYGNSSFVLMQPERIHFRGLTFVNCSAECPKEFNNTVTYPLVDYAALCVYRGESISISDCVFRNSTGTGVIMHDVVGRNQVVNTNFTRNNDWGDDVLPADQDYQLWAVSRSDGETRSIAVIASKDMTLLELSEAQWRLIKDSESLMLTIEEEGGSAIDEPSDELVARGLCVRLKSGEHDA